MGDTPDRINMEKIVGKNPVRGKLVKEIREKHGIVVDAFQEDGLVQDGNSVCAQPAAGFQRVRRQFARMVEMSHEPCFFASAETLGKRFRDP